MCTETMTLPDPEARPQPWEPENFSWKTSVCGSVFSVRCWKSMPRRTKQGGSFGGRRPIFRPVNEDQPEKNRPLIFCRYLWKILEVWLNVSSWIQVDVTKKNRKEDSESQKLSENPKAQPWNPEFTACVPRFFSAQDQCLGLGQIMLLHAHATNVASLSEKELIVAGLGWCFWVIYPLVI
jgi:hypothetical protein